MTYTATAPATMPATAAPSKDEHRAARAGWRIGHLLSQTPEQA